MIDPYAPPPEAEEPDGADSAVSAALEALSIVASAVIAVAILVGSLGGIFYMIDRWFFGL